MAIKFKISAQCQIGWEISRMPNTSCERRKDSIEDVEHDKTISVISFQGNEI